MNPLRPLVDKLYFGKNYPVAFLLFLLPLIASVGYSLVAGFDINPLLSLIVLIRELIYWVLVSALLYILLLAIKGKEVQGNFGAIFSAYSSVFLLNFLFFLIGLLVAFVFLPDFFSILSQIQSGTLSIESFYPSLPQGIMFFIFVGIFFLLALISFLSLIYIIFRIGNNVKETKGFSNSLFLVLFIGLNFILVNALNIFFSAIIGLF